MVAWHCYFLRMIDRLKASKAISLEASCDSMSVYSYCDYEHQDWWAVMKTWAIRWVSAYYALSCTFLVKSNHQLTPEILSELLSGFGWPWTWVLLDPVMPHRNSWFTWLLIAVPTLTGTALLRRLHVNYCADKGWKLHQLLHSISTCGRC